MGRLLNRRHRRRAAIAKWLVLAFISVSLFGFRSDGLAMSPPEELSVEFAHDLIGWHLANSHSKWTHRLRSVVSGLRLSDSDRFEKVGRFFELGDEIRQLTSQMESGSASGRSHAELREVETRLERLRSLRAALRNDVEETIESEVSTVIRANGLGLFGDVVFPPVDVRLEAPPMLLVTSPRDRIERLDDVLLEPDMSIESREEVEERVTGELGLSSLILEIGGVATYPASVHHGADLRNTLRLAAHEWVHHYLVLKPLGRNPYSTPELMVLNETVASIAGDEIGDLAFASMRARKPEAGGNAGVDEVDFHVADLAEHTEGDFGTLMRETRLTVDRLLAEGDIEEAESYMEDRRKLLTESGHPIRKLNQAYFAFYGTYAHSPASVDPIGPQVRRLRELSEDVGEFLTLAGSVTSSEGFLELIARIESAGSSQ